MSSSMSIAFVVVFLTFFSRVLFSATAVVWLLNQTFLLTQRKKFTLMMIVDLFLLIFLPCCCEYEKCRFFLGLFYPPSVYDTNTNNIHLYFCIVCILLHCSACYFITLWWCWCWYERRMIKKFYVVSSTVCASACLLHLSALFCFLDYFKLVSAKTIFTKYKLFLLLCTLNAVGIFMLWYHKVIMSFPNFWFTPLSTTFQRDVKFLR